MLRCGPKKSDRGPAPWKTDYPSAMRTHASRRRSLLTSVATLGCVGALLVGCSGETDTDGAATEVTGTVVESDPSSDADAGGKGPDSTESVEVSDASAPGQDPNASCGDAEVVNPLTGGTPIPVVFTSIDDTDGRFYYTPDGDRSSSTTPRRPWT